MNRLSMMVALALVCGCQTTTTTTDLAVLPPGCRAPSACWTVACDCTLATIAGCKLCEPTQEGDQTCTCDDADAGTAGTQCLEQGQLCVGRQAAACPGYGARCIPSNLLSDPDAGSCASGRPPDVIAVLDGDDPDAGLHTEQHCSFTDDTCCPGSSTPPPDLGADLSATVPESPDLSATVDLATDDGP